MTHLKVGFFLGSIICIFLVALTGVVLNRVAIRPVIHVSRMSVLLSTLGASFLMLHGATLFWGGEPKSIKVPFHEVHRVCGIAMSEESIILILVGVVSIIVFYIWLKKSPLGKTIRATAQNPIGANLCGINTRRVFDYTMAISSGLAALSGVLLSPVYSASASMGQPLLLIGFVIVIVGGLGSFKGTIVVGIFVGIVEALFGQYIDAYYRSAFTYAIMILVLLLKPQGLYTKS